MESVADMEDASEKNPVTPGQLLPVREMFGDLLLELGKPKNALAQYEKCLTINPNRFNSIYGAGRSAELIGNKKKAKNYYTILLKNCESSDLSRERLKHASNIINNI